MLEQVIPNKAGWTRVAFGDVVRKVSDKVDPWESGLKRYVAGEHLDTDDLRIRRWGLIGDDYLGPAFHMRFKPGHVLYGSRRTYLRKVALADFEGITANTTYVVESQDPKVLMPELLPFIMQTEAFHAHSIARSKGSVNPYVNFSDIACFEFLLPPIQEQARLVKTLSAAEDLQSRLYDLEKTTNTARLTIYLDCFLTDRRVKSNACVGDVATVRNGTTPSRKNPDFWDGDVPWLPTGKANERYIAAPDEYITQEALEKCSLRMIPAKSTLVAMIGQGKTRGKSAFLEIDSTINQNFAAVTPGPNILPEFLFYQLDACYEPLRYWSHGSNQHALNTELVAEFPIWVPNEGTQREIVDTVSQLETEVRQVAARRQTFRSVYKRIVTQAFSEI